MERSATRSGAATDPVDQAQPVLWTPWGSAPPAKASRIELRHMAQHRLEQIKRKKAKDFPAANS